MAVVTTILLSLQQNVNAILATECCVVSLKRKASFCTKRGIFVSLCQNKLASLCGKTKGKVKIMYQNVGCKCVTCS